jgi:hypothetical protein
MVLDDESRDDPLTLGLTRRNGGPWLNKLSGGRQALTPGDFLDPKGPAQHRPPTIS